MRPFSRLCALVVLLLFAATVAAQDRPRRGRGRGRWRDRQAAPIAESVNPPQLAAVEAESELGMVVSGSPEASEIGAGVLAGGGNAIDAAVAMAFAIGVAEPGQSGIGGQTYILVYLADGRSVAIDGSALAPLRVDRDALAHLDEIGQRYGSQLAATPGTAAALSYALSAFGTRPLAEMIAPAIELAAFGTVMTSFQRASLEEYIARVRAAESLDQLYLKDGWELWELGHRSCNPELARTLWRLSTHGTTDFYRGAVAQEIVAEMKRSGGFVGVDDLSRYSPVVREPLRGSYRGHEVLSFPAPCSGGAVIESLHILENFSPQLLATRNADSVHVMAETTRLAAFDDHVVRSLDPRASAQQLDKRHAARRAAQIRLDRVLELEEMLGADDGAWRDRDTTHISVIDAFGNAVSLTQSLGRGFGSCTGARTLGFPFNGILESFEAILSGSRYSLMPLRPLFTSISPTIILRGGRPFLVLGSAGSGRIIPVVVSLAVAVIDGQATLAEAQSLPRVYASGGRRPTLAVELADPIDQEMVAALQERGFRVRPTGFPATAWNLSTMGGANAILARSDGALVGVCDPRRGGLAAGVCTGGDLAGDGGAAGITWVGVLGEWPAPTTTPAPMSSPVD
jgi:gamma-glutamyltranspeptidase / glutathione hydrolase